MMHKKGKEATVVRCLESQHFKRPTRRILQCHLMPLGRVSPHCFPPACVHCHAPVTLTALVWAALCAAGFRALTRVYQLTLLFAEMPLVKASVIVLDTRGSQKDK